MPNALRLWLEGVGEEVGDLSLEVAVSWSEVRCREKVRIGCLTLLFEGEGKKCERMSRQKGRG